MYLEEQDRNVKEEGWFTCNDFAGINNCGKTTARKIIKKYLDEGVLEERKETWKSNSRLYRLV